MNKRLLLSLMGALALVLVPMLTPAADAPPASGATTPLTTQDFVFLGEARPVLIRMHIQTDGKALQAAWDDCIDYLFKYLDVDNDGALSKEEVERAPTVEQVTNGLVGVGGLGQGGGGGGRLRPGATPAAPTMQDLDTNKDGKVSREELAAWYRKNGFQPFQFRLGAGAPNFQSMIASYLGGSRPEPTIDEVSKGIFQHLDRSKKGQITKEDLEKAESILMKLDEDQDEMIVPRELVAYDPAGNNPLKGLLQMGLPGGGREAPTSTTNLVPVLDADKVPVDLVKRLREHYGKEIHIKEIGLDEATFKALDADGNGVLDDKELAGFAKRAPDLELLLRLGTKGANQSMVALIVGDELPPVAKGLTLLNDLGFLDLGLTRAEIRVDDYERPNPLGAILKQQVQTQFEQADKDHNGILEAKEIQDSRFFKPLAKAIDRNGDGCVTEKKLTAYVDFLQELTKRARAGTVTLEITDQSRGLFDMLDTDRDGRLSVRELREAPRLLAKLDHGKKGYLTADDIPHSYRIEVKRGPQNQGGPGGFFDLYSQPAVQAGPARAEKGPVWFRKMDRNRDGDVSRKEFLFGEELFRLIDTDGDGLISLAEAEKAAELIRKRGLEEDP
jgi:Ca2+-binding EF-hand superfamily protein